VSSSPIDELLEALDKLDAPAAMKQMAADCRLLTVDGRRAEGTEAVRALLSDFLAQIHSTSHRVSAQWHQDNVWIAEVLADYELNDWMQMKDLPRAFVLHQGPGGIVELNVYGAHERPLIDHGHEHEGMHVGGRWVPPL
jgi:hypothetical protein